MVPTAAVGPTATSTLWSPRHRLSERRRSWVTAIPVLGGRPSPRPILGRRTVPAALTTATTSGMRVADRLRLGGRRRRRHDCKKGSMHRSRCLHTTEWCPDAPPAVVGRARKEARQGRHQGCVPKSKATKRPFANVRGQLGPRVAQEENQPETDHKGGLRVFQTPSERGGVVILSTQQVQSYTDTTKGRVPCRHRVA